jgi:hypothetical protein
MDRSVGIVVPAYQPDTDRLIDYVQSLASALQPTAIRIELDAPDTGVMAALSDLPATVHSVPTRRGKGAAITDGFERLETDVLAFVDADGSTPPPSVEAVIDPVKTGSVALAVGSRRHPDSIVHSHQTYARRWLGHAFARVARLLLDAALYDYQCGAKAIDRDAWQAVRGHLYEPGFAWDIELVAMTAALGYNIEEIPIEWEDYPGSTVSPIGTSLQLAQSLFAVRHRAKLLGNDPLHSALETYRADQPALVERPGPNDD